VVAVFDVASSVAGVESWNIAGVVQGLRRGEKWLPTTTHDVDCRDYDLGKRQELNIAAGKPEMAPEI
jgi:predicted transglutaminase-like cysteine proteinase